MDFTGVTSITIPEGNVTKITKENGVILWKKADTNYHQNLKCYLSASNNTRNGYNESATTWEDLSGNNNDFTLTNVTFDGLYANFNGTDSIGKSNFILSYPYTVIVKLTNVSQWKSATTVPVHNYDTTTSTKGDGIIQRASAAEVSFRTGTIATTSFSKPTTNSVVVAYTRSSDGGTGKTYVNGVLKGTKTGLTGNIAYPYVIGGSQTLWYSGGIECLKIYDAELTLEEIVDETAAYSTNIFKNDLSTSTMFTSLPNNGIAITNNYSTKYCAMADLDFEPNTTYYIHADKEYSHTRANATGRITNTSGIGVMLEYNTNDGTFTTGDTIEGNIYFYGMSQSQAGVTDEDVVVKFKNMYIGKTPYIAE